MWFFLLLLLLLDVVLYCVAAEQVARFLKKAFCCDNVWVGSHSSKDPHTQKMPPGFYLTLKWMAARKVLAKSFVAKTVRIAYNVHTR